MSPFGFSSQPKSPLFQDWKPGVCCIIPVHLKRYQVLPLTSHYAKSWSHYVVTTKTTGKLIRGMLLFYGNSVLPCRQQEGLLKTKLLSVSLHPYGRPWLGRQWKVTVWLPADPQSTAAKMCCYGNEASRFYEMHTGQPILLKNLCSKIVLTDLTLARTQAFWSPRTIWDIPSFHRRSESRFWWTTSLWRWCYHFFRHQSRALFEVKIGD